MVNYYYYFLPERTKHLKCFLTTGGNYESMCAVVTLWYFVCKKKMVEGVCFLHSKTVFCLGSHAFCSKYLVHCIKDIEFKIETTAYNDPFPQHVSMGLNTVYWR